MKKSTGSNGRLAAIDYFYFIIDTSESMRGNKIGAVNDAINNLVVRLRKVKISKSITPKVVSLTYDECVSWSNPLPIDVSSFSYFDSTVSGSASNLGKALLELDSKLKRQGEASNSIDSNTTIIFFTDGLATDDIEEPKRLIFNNPVYVKASRIAVTFEDELSVDIAKDNLVELVGGEENIVIDDFVELNRMIFEQYK